MLKSENTRSNLDRRKRIIIVRAVSQRVRVGKMIELDGKLQSYFNVEIFFKYFNYNNIVYAVRSKCVIRLEIRSTEIRSAVDVRLNFVVNNGMLKSHCGQHFIRIICNQVVSRGARLIV